MVTELFRRQRIPELYAALGSLWILTTSLAIPWLSGESLVGAWLEVSKGLGFVAVSALLVRDLVVREPGAHARSRSQAPLRWQLAGLLALSTLAGAVGACVGSARSGELLAQQREKLQLVAELQARQLAAWQTRRLSDAERMRQNRALLAAFTSHGAPLADANARIAELERIDGIEVALFDDRCKRLAGRPWGDDAPLAATCAEALENPDQVAWRISRGSNGHLRMELAVPIRPQGGVPLGVAAIREDLGRAVLPELRDLVLEHHAVGSVLLKREGDSFIKLTSLSGAPGAAESLEPAGEALPVDERALDALAGEGEVPLVSAYAEVGDGPLRVLATSPHSEAFQGASPQVRYAFVSAGLSLLLGALALYGWRSRSEALIQAAGKAEAERELAELAKKEWEHLVLELPELGVALADAASGKLVYANERFAQLLDRDRDSLVGEAWQPAVAPEQAPAVADAVLRLVEGESDHVTLELSGLDPRRVEQHTVTDLRALRGNDGKITHLAAIVRDVTDDKNHLAEREALLREQHAGLLGSIDAIARMIEVRDPYTAGHQRKVSQLAGAIGEELGLDERRVEGLRVAGKIHDLGKVACPAEILVKPGPLTMPEQDLARLHVEEGAKILGGLALPWPLAEIVLQHHEHVDGSGYPRQLRGDDILLEARIIRVASSFVALTSHRPYRRARTLTDALDELQRHAGTRYDVDVVKACARLTSDGSFFANGGKAS